MSPKHIWQKIYRDDYEEYEEKKLPEIKFNEQIGTIVYSKIAKSRNKLLQLSFPQNNIHNNGNQFGH